MAEAGGLEDEYQSRKDKGFLLINVIGENLEYAAPTQEELKGWSDDYGMSLPVVADPSFGTAYTYATGGMALPYMVLLDRGMVVSKTGTVSAQDVDALLE